ncbi:flagellar biosynthetic protein FlhB [Sphingobium sp. B1D7B]|uniref:EscU/YscU/HrcU family type III secretion system export apparatus switch protein n=1 Tax=unclassified Sphingobium TaxID=2611147 RepID=UPI00222452BD|nr:MULTISPECIES: flagellar type III secretion system protein FlhB [unclassified Sphingobium]MCW2371070.1 flagellar biosynthetic protein FlhB [Sphingobium sp. B11D3D]MCW2383512.1 flagellar biosynthetic protein FlhB [Sphingobium sp. B2D3B]MCW2392562.1 flagellar biosynthetic protein FlhB [Sphingobium sp. B11D3A]MCW2399513.1 flagellar biosynthetic protein FlhB [Sphingobium sp. B2D3C]MCW2404257.1 flagellar biosynthetic protein FlhB [Sphingobium sp. B1D7B]
MAQEASGGGEKTEKPTAKRLTDAASKGDILQSRELSTAMVVMAGVGWLAIAGPALIDAIRLMLAEALRFDQGDIAGFAPEQRAYHLLAIIALPLAGVLLATVVAAIAAPAVLGSLGFRTGALVPKPERMNPINGLKRIFGMQGIIELVKSLAKVVLLGSIGGVLLWRQFDAIHGMAKTGVMPAMSEMGHIFVVVTLALAAALFLIAGIDVPAQIFQRMKRLNMSKQEVKQEHKETEGSPELKGAIRRRQYETLNGSVRKAVEEATVVLTNPTHFAVALRYHPGRDAAPVVVARGSDEIAAAIRTLAADQGRPVLQYPELTRAIYFTSRAGQEVDERLFMAVAAILAFVYRIEHAMATEMDRPHIDLPDAMRFDADGRNIVN